MVRSLPALFALALTACGGPTPYVPPSGGSLAVPPDEATTDPGNPTSGGGGADVDSDGDGLSDSEEAQLGSDPHEADTDGDGWEDGEEVAGNTDPTEAADHPYAGGWPIDACRDDLAVTGNGIGQVTEDFALLDQHGETVRLHDFCGQEVLLVSSATWCGACQGEAPGLQALYDEYADQGFLVITLLGENQFGGAPSQGDLQAWADAFGLEHPVLADPNWGVTIRYIDGYSIALPAMSLIGPGGTVLVRNQWVGEGTIVDNLP